jgi:lysophospholipase L1-like esterase
MNCGATYRYLALGDSYTIGEGVILRNTWPHQVVVKLRHQGYLIADPFIIARTGWTTYELAEAIEQSGLPSDFDIVSLMIGVNNQYRNLPMENYRRDFIDLLQVASSLARDDPNRVFVLSIPDWSVTPYATGRDRQKLSAAIDRFNTICRQEAERLNITFVDIKPASRRAKHDISLLAGDGLHPSGKMYTLWVELVAPVMRQILDQKQKGEIKFNCELRW